MPISATNLNKAYLAYFGRPADAVGQAYFATLEQADVIKAFDASAESQAIYGGDTAAKINAIYKNLFNREAEPAGLAYWLSLVSSGRVTPAGAAFSILEGAEGTDKTAIDNKLAASEAFIKAMDTTTEIVGYSGLNAAASARAFLATVGASAESLTAAVAGAQAALTAASTAAGGNEAGFGYILKTTQDNIVGTSGNDFIRGVVGAAVGQQEQTTFNSSDVIDGGAGSDALILNMVGDYVGGARVKSVETLTLGNNVGSTTFDFNINQGANEITDVQTIEFDQINTGETLTVRNIVKTAGAAGADIATLLWDNEVGSTAGRVVANFRSSAVAGATTVNVQLDDVAASKTDLTTGVLDIGGGVETIVITSQGTTRNTLNAANHGDGWGADIASASADGVNDNGALTKVVVNGAQALGLAPGVITNDDVGETNFGLTNHNHVANSDRGLNNAQASASNFASVQATVTEIDATAADGGVAMSFVSRVDGAAVNTTFKGGKAADSIVFQRGNVNGSGGEGADTFAFINPGLTNFDFGSADTLAGGAGSDTIILGMNGVGTITANTTEFNNKAGIEVLDLRGATNTVTLADAFVAGVDVGTFTVRTDRIVQSAASEANPTPSNATNNAARENNSINTVVLTELADNRAINFIGGSGSDRVVVDNASANQFTALDGGTNAAANSQDSLTVVDTSVLDDRDVANIKNFEFVNLVESRLGNSSFNLSLTEAFVLANSNGLVIGSTSNTYGVEIGAGDVVNLEISDLLNGAAMKTTLTARTINVQDLIAAGATVNFQNNGVTVSTNAAPAALATFAITGTAPTGNTVDDVPGAVVVDNVALTNTAAIITANATALTGGAGTADTLTVADAGIVTVGSVTTALETLVLANGTNTVTFAQAGFRNVTGGTGNDSVDMLNLALTASANLGAGTDTLTVDGVRTGTFVGGDGTDTMVFAAAANIAGATVSGFEFFTLAGAGSMTAAQYNAFGSGANAGGGADVLTITTAGSIAGDADIETYSFGLAGSTNDYTYSGAAAAQTINGNTGADSVTYTVAGLANDTINLGAGTDTLNIAANETAVAAFTLAGPVGANAAAVTGVEVVNITVAQTAVNALTMFNGAATVNASAGARVVLGTGGQTFVSSGVDAMDVTVSTGVDTLTLGSTGVDTVRINAANSNSGSIDTINGFAAGAGNDVLITGTIPTTLWAQTVATATTANLAASLQTAISAAITAAAGNWDGNTDAGFITITSFNGGGAATFLVQNTSGADALFTAADMVVQLVGTTGTLTVADFA